MAKTHLVLATTAARAVARVVGRALCGFRGGEQVVHSAEEFRGRCDQCQRCADQLHRLVGNPQQRRTA